MAVLRIAAWTSILPISPCLTQQHKTLTLGSILPPRPSYIDDPGSSGIASHTPGGLPVHSPPKRLSTSLLCCQVWLGLQRASSVSSDVKAPGPLRVCEPLRAGLTGLRGGSGDCSGGMLFGRRYSGFVSTFECMWTDVSRTHSCI